ncbi:dUTP diphosphatase [Priestia megaterium]|uniref:dUTP diphosphatase n=1 Tax=Priestia megaterium TaxID=1404 RepID=UPI00215FD703|nr:dUTP diphosphatase [Priestia megaterium]MCR8927501.1 dUTP diphosphatase [Priestia megaterium]
MHLLLKIYKEHPEAKVPSYAHPGDAGLDLYSIEEKIIEPGQIQLIHTGIKIELPKDTEAQIRPRSGLALKHGITVLNSPGTIDEGYRGEIGVILINHGIESFLVEKNMKIAQMVVKPIVRPNIIEVEKLTNTERSEGGFGSSGTH